MDEELEQEKPSTTITIGDRLSEAREKAGLTLEDVAADLLLKPEYIRSIEANELQNLSAPTYVKGYIRSYARLLGLDPADMLDEYESLGYDQPGWSITENQQKKPESVFKLLSLAIPVGLVLTGLFIAWLVTSGYLNPPVEEDYLTSETTDDAAESIPAAAKAGSNEQKQPGATPSLELNASQALVSVTQKTEDTDIKNPLVPGGLSTEAPIQTEKSNAVALVDENISSQDEAQIPEVTNSSTEAGSTSVTLAATDFISADAGNDEVIVIVMEDSWIEIEDASRQQLLNGLFKPGDVKILTGQAPFQVFLGNANGVELTINGIDYDVKSRKRENNTARFALVSPL